MSVVNHIEILECISIEMTHTHTPVTTIVPNVVCPHSEYSPPSKCLDIFNGKGRQLFSTSLHVFIHRFGLPTCLHASWKLKNVFLLLPLWVLFYLVCVCATPPPFDLKHISSNFYKVFIIWRVYRIASFCISLNINWVNIESIEPTNITGRN